MGDPLLSDTWEKTWQNKNKKQKNTNEQEYPLLLEETEITQGGVGNLKLILDGFMREFNRLFHSYNKNRLQW